MMRIFEKLAHVISRHQGAVLLAWLVSLALSAALLALHPSEAFETELSGATGTEAHQVAELLEHSFGLKLGSTMDLVVDGPVDSRALTDNLQAAFPAIARVTELTGDRPHRQHLFHLEFRPDMPLTKVQAQAGELRRHLATYAGGHGLTIQVTGSAAFQHDAKVASKKDSKRGENLSLLVSLAVLVGIFGALTAAAIPLLIGVTTLVQFNALANLLHLSVNPVSQILGALVGMALAVDYSVFLVSRFREELARGATPAEAIAVSLTRPGRTLLFSALIMMASVGALWLPDVSLSRAVVTTLLLVVALSLFNALVLLPALLTFKPSWLDRPRVLSRWIQRLDMQPLWRALASHVADRPRRYFALACALLVALSAPALHMKLWEPVQAIAPRESESMQAYRALEADGWGGELVPVVLAVKAAPGRNVYQPETIHYVAELTQALRRQPEVAAVRSLTSWNPRFETPDYIRFFTMTSAMPWLSGERFDRLVNRGDGSTVTLVVAYPKSLMDLEATDAILRFTRQYKAQHPEREVLVGGVVARVKDFTHELYRHTPWVLGGVVLGIYALLLLYMRSAVLPLKAALMNFLPIVAAYGVLTAVFQQGAGSALLGTPVNGAVTNTVPIVLFCVVFGLSMDYEVLILSRITEAYREGRPVREAVVEGLAKSGSLITGAALILLGVFTTGIFSSSPQTQEICLGISAAIAIDATIVRFLLVPSFMVLLGRWNWWAPAAESSLDAATANPQPERDSA